MVNAGIVPATAPDNVAAFCTKVFPKLKVNDAATVKTGGEIPRDQATSGNDRARPNPGDFVTAIRQNPGMGWLERTFGVQKTEPTLGARITQAATVLLLLIFAAVGVLVLWAFPRQDRLATEREARLKTTEGAVNSTRLTYWRERRRENYWELEVWYQYRVDGKGYQARSARFHSTSLRFFNESEALEARGSWADGARVTVWYDAANPGDSALDPAWKPVSFLLPWAAGIVLLSLLAAVSIARATLRGARQSPIPAGEITRALRNVRNICGAFACTAIVVLAVHGFPVAYHQLLVKPRLATAVPIFFWELDVHNGPPTPVSKYRFRPERRQEWFEGTSWRFGRTGLATLEEAEAVKDRLQAAHRESNLRVFYLPSDPARCALTPNHGGVIPRAIALAAAFVLAAAGAVTVLSSRALDRRPAVAETAPRRRLRKSGR